MKSINLRNDYSSYSERDVKEIYERYYGGINKEAKKALEDFILVRKSPVIILLDYAEETSFILDAEVIHIIGGAKNKLNYELVNRLHTHMETLRSL